MERFEVKVKYEQIKKLMEQGQYQEAMEIANTIDWDKSRNIHMLCLAGEVFERCGLFEDSKAIYLRAYQLQPQSRIVIYRLAELSIKLSDYEDSIHFYKEYEAAAPYDVNLFVLRYKIYKAKGASTETLLSILEELKENDYHERWAYELAKLYSDAGMIDKCVAECDEINLWFGDGRYVRKALQLKKRYQMLTSEQQKKLDESQTLPHGSAEAISKKDEAEEKQRQTKEAFDNLSNQTGEDVEQARKAAIDAAREARAAQLLEEAALEDEQEEAELEEKDGKEFIGQGIYPNLDIPIPEREEAPVVEARKAKAPGFSESDILARNIALALEGKLPRQRKSFEDDYIMDSDLEDDNTPEDEEIFEKKESAFHKMWRMTSEAVTKKPKAATVIAKEQDYDIQIKPVTVSRYDTINLQKELARSIRSIMNATEKEEVEKTMEDINRSMEESNIPKLIQTKRLHIKEVQEALVKSGQEKKETLAEEVEVVDSKMQRLLGEEYDGQLRMIIEEEKHVEKQITGQMRIDDILKAEEQIQLNEAKKRALEQAEEYIDQLSAVVPYMEEWEEVDEQPQPIGDELKQKVEYLMSTEIESKGDLERVVSGLTDILKKVNGLNIYAEKVEAALEQAATSTMKVEEVSVEEASEQITEEISDEEFAEDASVEGVLEDIEGEAEEETEAESAEELAEYEKAMEEVSKELAQNEEDAVEERSEGEESEEAETEEETVKQTFAEGASDDESTEKAVEDTNEQVTTPEYPLVYGDEQKRILSYFAKFAGVEDEIADFMGRDVDRGEHIVITGTKGSGRTSLALRLMKAVASNSEYAPRKIAKLSALALNKKPVEAVFGKIGEGTLVIENAENLEDSTCRALYKAMIKYANRIRIILIGETDQVESLLLQNGDLEQQFAYTFHLHDYKNDELVEFARDYAQTKGYGMDEMATLALYTRLADEKIKRPVVTLGDVKKIVDEAISQNENRKGVKNFISNMLMKNVDEDGNLILREKDFEV